MMQAHAPLDGVRVLDLSRVLAGPYATMLLADLGAEVTKIEAPSGDDTRHWGPPFVGSEAAYFLSVNRGKKSVVLDLSTADGQAEFRRLAADADVVVENFRTGRMDRWGIGSERLRQENRGLIYAAITGWGNTGPSAHLPGYATLVEAMSGLMSITGEPGGEPMKVGVALVDVLAGSHLVGAINAALVRRAQTGLGGRVDVSLLESCLSSLANQAGNYFATGQSPARLGNAHPNIVPYQLFFASDRPLMIAVGNDAQFSRFASMLGHDEWSEDQRFLTNAGRVAHREDLVPQIAAALVSRSADHWLREAARADVPIAPVNSIAETMSEPQIAALGMVHGTTHRTLGEVLSVRHPVRFDGVAPTSDKAPPELGQHTDEILHSRRPEGRI